MLRKYGDLNQVVKNVERSALVSHGYASNFKQRRKCISMKKSEHIHYCWDFHPEKKNARGSQNQPPYDKKIVATTFQESEPGALKKRRESPVTKFGNLKLTWVDLIVGMSAEPKKQIKL